MKVEVNSRLNVKWRDPNPPIYKIKIRLRDDRKEI